MQGGERSNRSRRGGAHEEAVIRAQELGDKELEELLLDAARVDALLADKVHAQRLEEVLFELPRDLVHGIFHQVVAPHAHHAHVGVPVSELAVHGRRQL